MKIEDHMSMVQMHITWSAAYAKSNRQNTSYISLKVILKKKNLKESLCCVQQTKITFNYNV